MRLFTAKLRFSLHIAGHFFLLCILFGAPLASAAVLQAGSAKVEITPEPGTPLSGYGKLRGKPSSGIHDPIYARAAALSMNGETFVLLSLDLCLIDRHLRESIFNKINALHPIKESNLLITATHTHTGSGAVGKRLWQKFIMGSFDQVVFDKLTAQAAQAAVAALAAREQVQAETGDIPIDDLIENRMIGKLRYPQQLKVLRFRNNRGMINAQIVSMAAHPTLFPAKDRLEFSADYPGRLTSALDSDNTSGTSVFINGAAGDLRPHAPAAETKLERLNLFSEELIRRARQIKFTQLSLEGPWIAAYEKRKLPRVRVRAGLLTIPSLIGNRFFPRHTYFQALRTGPLVIFTVPGELSSELGFEAENRFLRTGLRPFLAGYANDYVGYIIPRRYYGDRHEYEARVSFYGEDFDLFIQEQFSELIPDLLTEQELLLYNRHGKIVEDDGLPVLSLSGDSYHQGYEEGRLFRDEIHKGLDQIFGYFRRELKVPVVNRLIIYWTATRAWRKLEPFLSYDELRQIEGIADGAGISRGTMRQLHAMPELFPTLCTNGAYWGDATENSSMIAIRNLDWNRDMKIFDLAAVKYHEGGLLPSYVNIGYSGFSGVLSGMNTSGISIGEIGADSADGTLAGLGMPFLQKRILETSESLDDAAGIFKRSELTQGYNYVIADAAANKAMVVEATQHHLAFFTDNDPKEAEVPYAFRLKDAVFRGDPALDAVIRDLQWASKGNPEKPGPEEPRGSAYETRYLKHGQLVEAHFGKITPETAAEIAREVAPRSNIQSVIYHFPYFDAANAEGDKRAVDSRYYRFDIRKFSETR